MIDENTIKEQDIRFIIGVLAHYIMETTSVSSKRRAIEIMTKLNKELARHLVKNCGYKEYNHD